MAAYALVCTDGFDVWGECCMHRDSTTDSIEPAGYVIAVSARPFADMCQADQASELMSKQVLSQTGPE